MRKLLLRFLIAVAAVTGPLFVSTANARYITATEQATLGATLQSYGDAATYQSISASTAVLRAGYMGEAVAFYDAKDGVIYSCFTEVLAGIYAGAASYCHTQAGLATDSFTYASWEGKAFAYEIASSIASGF